MNSDIEFHIRQSYLWIKLPQTIKQQLGQDQKEYDKAVFQYSVKNQLRYKDNLIHKVYRGERRYYEELLKYSRKNLMLYPYHLQDVMIKGLRTTPFAYYVDIVQDLMTSDRSYDCLPNFSAADCLRLLGIGRNQYIELMNRCRVGGGAKRFLGVGLPRARRWNVKDLLPVRPVDSVALEPWWDVNVGWVTEEDVKSASPSEKRMIDNLIDGGKCRTGTLNYPILKTLYQKGLVYLDVPINDDDYIIVPTLEGFVMNRVTGDYLETLLYKIFVSIDEHTTVKELSAVLEIDLTQVKCAISMFCRLGFAYKKLVPPPQLVDADTNSSVLDIESEATVNHASWKSVSENLRQNRKTASSGPSLLDWSNDATGATLISQDNIESQPSIMDSPIPGGRIPETMSLQDIKSGLLGSGDNICGIPESQSLANIALGSSTHGHKLGFLFDSTLTAYLMMGNLSPGLKNHAVTMFEAGKLNDEMVDNFLSELDRIVDVGEGEARRYFEHAVNLRDTIRRLRRNPNLVAEDGFQYGLDLLRCASLLGLEPSMRSRILSKNYQLLVSMAPLSYEDGTVSSCSPVHLGPPIPEVNSVWFKLFLYHITKSGPPSLLLTKGSRLMRLPEVFHSYDRLLITTWNHDAALAPAANSIITINDALNHNPVLVQGYDGPIECCKSYVAFPLLRKTSDEGASDDQADLEQPGSDFPVIQSLIETLNLDCSCGFITLLQNKVDHQDSDSISEHEEYDGATPSASLNPVLLDLNFGVPLFSSHLNQLVCSGIIANKLHQPANQSSILKANRNLVLRLLKFLNDVNCNDTESSCADKGSEVPLPTKNLFFYNGVLRPF